MNLHRSERFLNSFGEHCWVSRKLYAISYFEVTFTKSADYNLPITCAVNMCGALQDLAGSKARQVAWLPLTPNTPWLSELLTLVTPDPAWQPQLPLSPCYS